jgi:hypothetical protein
LLNFVKVFFGVHFNSRIKLVNANLLQLCCQHKET